MSLPVRTTSEADAQIREVDGDRLGILQSAVDTANTAQARNSIEKMLCHQLAAAHTAAMNLLGYMGVEPNHRGIDGRQQSSSISQLLWQG